MDNAIIGDLIIFVGIIIVAAVIAMISRGIKYKKTRRIPPYKR